MAYLVEIKFSKHNYDSYLRQLHGPSQISPKINIFEIFQNNFLTKNNVFVII